MASTGRLVEGPGAFAERLHALCSASGLQGELLFHALAAAAISAGRQTGLTPAQVREQLGAIVTQVEDLAPQRVLRGEQLEKFARRSVFVAGDGVTLADVARQYRPKRRKRHG